MHLYLRQHLAVVGTAIILSVASYFTHLARADDPARAARESAVLDRMFANWKARHDRIRSVHFTWDCRSKYPKGSVDPTTRIFSRFDRDQEFDRFGVQMWIDGDNLCWIDRRPFKVPAPKSADRTHVEARWVSDGKMDSYALNNVRDRFPLGFTFQSATADEAPPPHAMLPLLLTFRPQHLPLSWRRETCNLVDEKAPADNGNYTKIQRVIKRSNTYPRREESCWVSPSRDDVIVHWRIEARPFPTCEGSIKYRKDQAFGWVPSEWSCDDLLRIHHECKVTSYAINEKVDPATFTQTFPAGTYVSDHFHHGYYTVQTDGSKKMLSLEEFNRILGASNPPQKVVPKQKAQ